MALIDEFKANLIGGGARANQFRVTITPPPGIAIGLDVRRASFLVRASNLPANKSNAVANSSALPDSSSNISLSFPFFSDASKLVVFAHRTTNAGISFFSTSIAPSSSPTKRRTQARRKPAFRASNGDTGVADGLIS